MLFMVCVSAFVPFTWVMVVGVGVSGFWWCVFQWCVAVVSASRRVPGVCVSWLVPGACSGVGWLGFGACVRDWGACVGVGVAGLVCVFWWFRMLTCLGLFPVFWLLSFVCLVNNAAWGGWCCFGVCVVSGGRLHVWLLLVGGCLAWCAFLGSCGYWVVVLFFWCALLCASVFGEGVLGESVCWRVWLFG